MPFQPQVNVNDSQKQQIATESDKNSTFRALFENIDCNEDCPMSEYYTLQELSKVNLEIVTCIYILTFHLFLITLMT